MLVVGRFQYLQAAVDSVRQQTQSSWELLIVQDGHNLAVREFIEKHFQGDPRIRYYYRGKLGTVSEASNFALAQARGEFCAILDDDDIWSDSQKLERQVAFLRANPDFVACGTGGLIIDQEDQLRSSFTKEASWEKLRRNALLANPIANSSSMFRRATALAIGGYDSSYPVCQDWEFWLRMGLQGKLSNLPEFCIKYRLTPNNASATKHSENAAFALKVVRRHKGEYPRAFLGYAFALGYFLYGMMPKFLRSRCFPAISTFKKKLFSGSSKSA